MGERESRGIGKHLQGDVGVSAAWDVSFGNSVAPGLVIKA